MKILPILIVVLSAAVSLPAIAGISSLIQPANEEPGSAPVEGGAKPGINVQEDALRDQQLQGSPGEDDGNQSQTADGQGPQDGLDENTGLPEVVEAPEGDMTFERMAEIVLALDPTAQVQLTMIQFEINQIPMTIVADPVRNRMRAFTPFKSLDGVDGQQLYRMMQSNFDSALDARYAIAQGFLIAAFIHPLRELEKEQLIEGIGQVVNLVVTYGTAYSSGAMTFGGGDSRNLHRQLIDELLKKGEEI